MSFQIPHHIKIPETALNKLRIIVESGTAPSDYKMSDAHIEELGKFLLVLAAINIKVRMDNR